MSETYKANVYCKNCDFSGEVEIEKGIKVEESSCPNCGCCELRRKGNVAL